MASYTNQTKSTTTFANEVRGFNDVTWDEATFTWDEANGTWADPRDVYTNQSKTATSFTNETKN